jgi:hypothetical protein
MIRKILAFPDIARGRMFKTEQTFSAASGQDDNVPAILFILTIFFYVVYQLAMEPGWVLGGEMWAEMATNYFPNANSTSYFQKLFSTDAGYIPAPQRLIALIGNAFSLPASSIPYFYTWSAITLTGVLIGAFCLAPFRKVVQSDLLRFSAAIAILIVADFETRTFISFSYFFAFFAAIITALALVDDAEEVPWWSWFLPVLMVSKPAVLAALPAMIIVTTVSKSRFRWITVATVSLCIGQLAQIAISRKAGVMPQANEITFLSKVIASAKYFFGFLGGYIFGPNFQFDKYSSILVGLFVLFAISFIIMNQRNGANSLIFIGVSLLFFNVLLNCFALSDSWNRDMTRLAGLPVYRHIIVGFFGCILIMVGSFASLTESKLSKPQFPAFINFGALVFIIWFVGSGWLTFGAKISREPGFPTLKNSQWQDMAPAIDSGVSPLCVPIDPLGFIDPSFKYSRNCTLLNPELNWLRSFRFERVQSIDNSIVFEVIPPPSLSKKTLVSLAVLTRPFTTQTTSVSVKAIIKLKDGGSRYYIGGRDLTISGGGILLTGKDNLPINSISSVRFVFSLPVEVALTASKPKGAPGVLWMGY